MKRNITSTILIIAITLAPIISYPQGRSYMAKKRFKLANPCPANGRTHGKCGGYIMDHIIPLCANGSDTADNLQWQTIKAAKQKDRLERMLCRCQKSKT